MTKGAMACELNLKFSFALCKELQAVWSRSKALSSFFVPIRLFGLFLHLLQQLQVWTHRPALTYAGGALCRPPQPLCGLVLGALLSTFLVFLGRAAASTNASHPA